MLRASSSAGEAVVRVSSDHSGCASTLRRIGVGNPWDAGPDGAALVRQPLVGAGPGCCRSASSATPPRVDVSQGDLNAGVRQAAGCTHQPPSCAAPKRQRGGINRKGKIVGSRPAGDDGPQVGVRVYCPPVVQFFALAKAEDRVRAHRCILYGELE